MHASPTPPITASLRRYQGEHAAHAHDFAQVLMGMSGCLELEVDGRAARVDASTGLVLPPGALHCFAADAAVGASVWVIDAPAGVMDTPRGAGLDRFKAFALWPGWSPADSAAHLLGNLAHAAGVQPRRKIDPVKLEAALTGSLHESWPVARMAALYCLSAPQFQARWQALTGLTPQAWLRVRRLNAAEPLLRYGWTLEAAALQVGYSSASALLFALQRDRGVSVRGLRKFEIP
jgi:AraC-like DNA-binding protein